MEMYQRQSRAASDAANLQYTVGPDNSPPVHCNLVPYKIRL